MKDDGHWVRIDWGDEKGVPGCGMVVAAVAMFILLVVVFI